jgi:hypothetical protein
LSLTKEIRTFKDDFEKDKSTFPQRRRKQLEKQISDWKLTGGNMYARRVNQLKVDRYPVNWRTWNLLDENEDNIYRRVAKDYLESFDNLARNGFHYEKVLNDQARLLLSRWSDLMLCFFLDLKEFELLPQPSSGMKYISLVI